MESAQFLEGLVPAFKIASGDNTFFPLLKTVAETGKPIIMSAGLATFGELKKSKEFIENVWQENSLKNTDLAILHCVVSYPTPAEEANLSAILDLKKLGLTVGYSDHTLGIDAAVLSVACGARIIEKHFTIDKNYSEFRDHQLSANPQDLKELVERVKLASMLLGSGGKKIQDAERGNIQSVRRSIVARSSLKKGSEISWDSLGWVRPLNGLPAGEEHQLLGKVLKRDISEGEPILPEDVA
ncbi:MAG TPA: N-acetylneuraminate synthase family protein, partial [Patescibacteria group bacterium]|nr:N-acetylneuraminate synthase family protein [Patescibacteria group bacterium]